MSIEFAIEQFDQCWDEAQPLFVRHKEELASWGASELAPDVEFYRRANAMDMVVFFTVRDCRKLIGYAAYAVRCCPHYVKEIWATSDTIIIMPEYRNEGLGDRFYEFIREECRKRGAKVVQTSVRADNVQGRALGMVLTHQGCKRMAITYAERLD